jgi:hypothetical protein
VIERSSSGLFNPSPTEAPDLIEPVVAFRSWRAMGARLRSPYVPVFWDSREQTATCVSGADPHITRLPHHAPHPHCRCGIYAYHEPDLDFVRVDYRGVVGIVSLWGRIEVHGSGMRAEHARVEALAHYSRWHSRQDRAVRTIAEELEVDLVELDQLEDAAGRYGRPLPETLLPVAETAPAVLVLE